MPVNTDIKVTITASDQASSVIQGVGKSIERTSDNFSQSIKQAGLIAAGALTGIVVAGSKMLDVATNIEQAKVAFETMTGSAKIAGDLMQKISDFAVKTPFELPGVISAAKQLLAMGSTVETVLPNLKMLGDLAAGTGAPLERLVMNFGQVQLQGKLTGRELRDFAVNGVGLLEQLAQQMGTTTESIMEMVSDGAIGFEEVRKAFENMTSGTGKFADLMDKQAKTFGGTMSNIRDQITRVSAEIMGISVSGDIREGSIFALAKKSAEGLLDAMNKMAPILTKFADMVVKNQAAVFGILGAVIAMATVAIVGFLAAMAGGLGALAVFVAVGAMIGVWFAGFRKSIQDMKVSIDTFWVPALTKAREWIIQTFTVIMQWFTTLGTSVTSWFQTLNTNVVNGFNTFVSNVQTALITAGTFIAGLPKMLGQALYEFVFGTIPFVFGFIQGFLTVGLPELIRQATVAIIIYLVQAIPQALETARMWFVNTGTAIMTEVSTWPGRFMAWLSALTTQAIALITKFSNDTKEKVTNTGTNIINEISTWPARFAAWLGTLPGIASKIMSDLWNTFSGWLGKVGDLFESWKNKAVGAWNAVRDAIQGAINKASEAFNRGVATGGQHFATGGVVPGPIGAPVMAMVHGGERITPTARSGAEGSGSGGGGVTFQVSVGLYAGSETEKRNIARDLYEALLQVAKSQNKTVADLMGG